MRTLLMHSSPDKLTVANYSHLKSIDGEHFWFKGRFHWVRKKIERFSSGECFSDLVYADFGCGTGILARLLDNHLKFKQVMLVDGHSHELSNPQQDNRFVFVSQDLEEDFKFETKVDLVTCLDVMEHLRKDGDFLERVRMQMRSGGKIILTVPAYQILFSKWDRQWGHHRRYSKKELMRLLETSGFEVQFCSYFWSFLFPFAILRKLKLLNGEGFPQLSSFVNFLFFSTAYLEQMISQIIRIPFGTSLLLVARVP